MGLARSRVKLDLRKNVVRKISSDLKIACFHEKSKESTRQPKYLERCKSKKKESKTFQSGVAGLCILPRGSP